MSYPQNGQKGPKSPSIETASTNSVSRDASVNHSSFPEKALCRGKHVTQQYREPEKSVSGQEERKYQQLARQYSFRDGAAPVSECSSASLL